MQRNLQLCTLSDLVHSHIKWTLHLNKYTGESLETQPVRLTPGHKDVTGHDAMATELSVTLQVEEGSAGRDLLKAGGAGRMPLAHGSKSMECVALSASPALGRMTSAVRLECVLWQDVLSQSEEQKRQHTQRQEREKKEKDAAIAAAVRFGRLHDVVMVHLHKRKSSCSTPCISATSV